VQYPQTTIQIAGHTDSSGSETYNQTLSERRGMSVQNALSGQGVDATRMQVIGFGEGQPIADNATETGRQLNRRVIVTIAPQQGATY
jgi:outer membrane protein OmpA-like peptidoglycan-associated protein